MGGDEYEKHERLGEGVFGVVYKGVSKETGDVVALKRIRLDSEEGVPQSVFREISVLIDMDHDNIVKLHKVFHMQSTVVLALEYCDTDVAKYLSACCGRLSPKLIQHIIRQLLLSIEYIHRHNIIHRDLKPHNLLLKSNLDLKLADFGLARMMSIPTKTYTSQVVTLWYRAPDVLLGSSDYGTAVDIWSVGIIFLELVLGEPPFQGTTETQLLLQMFRFFGTPSPDPTSWPSMHTYPQSPIHFSKPELTDIRFNQDLPALLTPCAMEKLGEEGVQLVLELLKFEPSHRITAAQALEHPYFRVQHDS
eukprot:PhF_6_TR12262/c0_g1_i1/m.19431